MESKLLRRIPILSTLTPGDLKLIERIAQAFDYAAGDTIFSRAESADAMFIVVGGRVRIFTRGASKKRKTFAYLTPGDFFGEMALLESLPRTATATATEKTRLHLLYKSKLDALLHAEPRIGVSIMSHLARMLSARLRRLSEDPKLFPPKNA